jgi:hypothetical protein
MFIITHDIVFSKEVMMVELVFVITIDLLIC